MFGPFFPSTYFAPTYFPGSGEAAADEPRPICGTFATEPGISGAFGTEPGIDGRVAVEPPCEVN